MPVAYIANTTSEDGPMLEVLKGFHGATIEAPTKKLWRPDPERSAIRFERFRSAA